VGDQRSSLHSRRSFWIGTWNLGLGLGTQNLTLTGGLWRRAKLFLRPRPRRPARARATAASRSSRSSGRGSRARGPSTSSPARAASLRASAAARPPVSSSTSIRAASRSSARNIAKLKAGDRADVIQAAPSPPRTSSPRAELRHRLRRSALSALRRRGELGRSFERTVGRAAADGSRRGHCSPRRRRADRADRRRRCRSSAPRDEVRGGEGAALDDVRAVARLQLGDVLAEDLDAARIDVDEETGGRAAAEGLEAEAARAGEEVEGPRALEPRRRISKSETRSRASAGRTSRPGTEKSFARRQRPPVRVKVLGSKSQVQVPSPDPEERREWSDER